MSLRRDLRDVNVPGAVLVELAEELRPGQRCRIRSLCWELRVPVPSRQRRAELTPVVLVLRERHDGGGGASRGGSVTRNNGRRPL